MQADVSPAAVAVAAWNRPPVAAAITIAPPDRIPAMRLREMSME